MTRWAVIADDLTGALDTALQFRKHGYQAIVSTQSGKWPCTAGEAAISAMSTASRHVCHADAYTAVQQAVRSRPLSTRTSIFKKTDSLLRGNIGPELQAALDSTGAATMIYAPAFPSGGRKTESGTLSLWGTPVTHGAAGHDPTTPPRESHIPTLIESTSDLHCRVIPSNVVQSGTSTLARAFSAARDANVQVVLPDVSADRELHVVAAAMSKADLTSVCAGSAGLAEALARRGNISVHPEPSVHPASHVLAIIGTPISHTQQQVAHALRAVSVATISLQPGRAAIAQALSAVHSAWSANQVALVDAVIPSVEPSPAQRSAREAQIVEFTAAVDRDSTDIGLVISGGDTARAAFDGFDGESIELAGEIGWGVPYGVLTSRRSLAQPVVTKAGLMGGPTALADAFKRIWSSLDAEAP